MPKRVMISVPSRFTLRQAAKHFQNAQTDEPAHKRMAHQVMRETSARHNYLVIGPGGLKTVDQVVSCDVGCIYSMRQEFRNSLRVFENPRNSTVLTAYYLCVRKQLLRSSRNQLPRFLPPIFARNRCHERRLTHRGLA